MRFALKIGMSVIVLATFAGIGARAQDAAPEPATQEQSEPQTETTLPLASEPVAQPEPNASINGVRIDACASDPSRLGLSRIVEIDTSDGPQFGGGHGGGTDFLKDGEVVLTFDDGPMRHNTRAVLKALAAHCTKGTFFMVGRMAAADPAMVKEVANAGHTVGSHTWSHQNLRALNLIKSRQDFEMGVSAINRALDGPAAPFFRFPYLGDSRQVGEYLKNRDVASWWVDVDSKDYQTRDPRTMNRRVMDALAVKRKGIILMHDIQPSTANGLKSLLDTLHAKGFKVVHIVPKGGAATIADYDRMIDKSFKSKAAAITANPLVDRSIVWTADPPKGAGALKPTNAQRAGKASPASAGASDLPWITPANANPKPAAAKSRKPTVAPVETLPWQPQTFGY